MISRTLTTEHLILRNLSLEVVEVLAQRVSGTAPTEAAESWIRRIQADVLDGAWSIHTREEGDLLGSFLFSSAVEDPGDVEISYMLLPEAQGRGFGGQAVAAAIAEIMRVRPDTRVFADVEGGNIPSERLLARLGFSPGPDEGVVVGFHAAAARRWRKATSAAPGADRRHQTLGAYRATVSMVARASRCRPVAA